MLGPPWGLRLSGVVLALCVACGSEEGSVSDATSYTLVVEVTDTSSGDPVKGAALLLVSDTLYEAEGLTNSDGRATLRLASDTAKTRLRTSKGGYVTQTQSVFFDTVHRDIAVELEPK